VVDIGGYHHRARVEARIEPGGDAEAEKVGGALGYGLFRRAASGVAAKAAADDQSAMFRGQRAGGGVEDLRFEKHTGDNAELGAALGHDNLLNRRAMLVM